METLKKPRAMSDQRYEWNGFVKKGFRKSGIVDNCSVEHTGTSNDDAEEERGLGRSGRIQAVFPRS